MQQDSVDLDVPEEKIPKRASMELLEGERLEDLEACVVGPHAAVHCAKKSHSVVNNSGKAKNVPDEGSLNVSTNGCFARLQKCLLQILNGEFGTDVCRM